jgi:hypothetical protein
MQHKMPCFYDRTTDKWYVSSAEWDLWDEDIVSYFISHNFQGPEINAFIKNHALSGR